MSGKTKKLSFEQWVDYVFDRPVTDPAWYWQFDEDGEEVDWWHPQPRVIAKYLARLFEDAGFLAARYTGEHLNQGFWYICGIGSNYFWTAREKPVPVRLQRRWVRALLPLYRDLFAKVCTAHLSHLSEGPESPHPLNSSCYMLWDRDTLEGAVSSFEHEHLVKPIFEVLERVLGLPSMACQESALHGLGHVGGYDAPLTRKIITEFLQKGPHIDPRLRRYAEDAREGRVQ